MVLNQEIIIVNSHKCSLTVVEIVNVVELQLYLLVMGNYAALFSKVGNASPKCHFVTYYSHFRVLGKRDLEIGNFDY